MAYTKLFNSIITSTIWSEDDKTRIVWITMLAIADKNGEVQGSIPGLARIAGVGVEDCRASINKFLSPDPDSRTKDDEGRRIEEIEGGWALLNHRKYREMATDADRAEQAAIRQQRARDKKKRNIPKVTQPSRDSHATVTPGSRQIPQAEAEANTDPLKNQNILSFSVEESPKPKPIKTVSPQILRIGKILNQGRRATTLLSDSEAKSFKSCDFLEEEIQLVESFYLFTERPNEPLHRRTGLLSLLNHWPDEVGKARNWAKKYGIKISALAPSKPLPAGYK